MRGGEAFAAADAMRSAVDGVRAARENRCRFDMRGVATIGAALLGLVLGAGDVQATSSQVVDAFDSIEGWTATASEGAQVSIAQEPGRIGAGLRIDYDLGNSQGFVIVRRTIARALPKNFAFTFDVRGEGFPNTLEFKLVAPSGRDVWWWRQRDAVWPGEWQPITIRRSRLDLAWSAAPNPRLTQVGAIEFAITPGEGGRGTVWIDELRFEERPVPAEDGRRPTVAASTTLDGYHAADVLDGSAGGWRSAASPEEQTLTIDLGELREFGGIVLDWDHHDYGVAFDVDSSADGSQWTPLHVTRRGNGGRDYLYLPDTEARWLRLQLWRSSRQQGYSLRRLRVEPIAFAASPTQFFEHVARDEPRGYYPKYLLGEQTYWTVLGVDGDAKEALLNEEGMLEVDRGGFSIEPFLWADDRLVTWSDVERAASLEDEYLPIPTVSWRHPAVGLRVTAFTGGTPGASVTYGRYRVENPTDHRATIRLFLAIRPFQVLPPWQALNLVGGVSPIRDLAREDRVVRVNRLKSIVALTPPDAFGATVFEDESITDGLRAGRVLGPPAISDPTGFASGVLAWDLELEAGASHEVLVAVPMHEPYVEALAAATTAKTARALVAAEQQAVRRRWQTLLSRVEVDIPAAPEVMRTFKSTLGYILVNRDAPALQPGSRTYGRSWIRDGAVTSAALLQTGFPTEVREFIRWYASHQFADGKIPCCIDRRGADAVPEHDSNGQFVWLVGEYYRYTRDVGLVADVWPHVVRAVTYLDQLRSRRTTDAYRVPERAAYFGLLPESISHEGYSSHPVHAYWDDVWALAGLAVAPRLANAVGDLDRAASWATLRDQFQTDLVASIPRAMAMHGIDYVPGSVELGDFDPASTAAAVALLADEATLRPAFERTMARYLDELDSRRRGAHDWPAYSPYELRIVEALVALGQRDAAHRLLDWVLADRRPLGWNQWAEVSWRDPAAPQFIGDMPHTWIGAIFVHAVRSMLVRERDGDRTLVFGAGVSPAWVERGVTVRRAPTPYGVVSFTLRQDGADAVRLRVTGDLVVPPGGFVLASPLGRPVARATMDGRPLETVRAGEVTFDRCPAEVVLHYAPVDVTPP